MAEWNPTSSSSRDHFLLKVYFRVKLKGLSERETSRSLKRLERISRQLLPILIRRLIRQYRRNRERVLTRSHSWDRYCIWTKTDKAKDEKPVSSNGHTKEGEKKLRFLIVVL